MRVTNCYRLTPGDSRICEHELNKTTTHVSPSAVFSIVFVQCQRSHLYMTPLVFTLYSFCFELWLHESQSKTAFCSPLSPSTVSAVLALCAPVDA